MKTYLFCCFLVAAPLLAQSNDGKTAPAPPAVLDENTRLMQEYVARREEWVALRRAALAKVKEAKDGKEKKQHFEKLAEDEKPALARMGEAARAYQAEKTKREQRATKPTPAPKS